MRGSSGLGWFAVVFVGFPFPFPFPVGSGFCSACHGLEFLADDVDSWRHLLFLFGDLFPAGTSSEK